MNDFADLDQTAREAVSALRQRITRADPDTIALLFTEARTHNGWQDRPVEDHVLKELFDLVRWTPTSANAQPARYVFVTSEAGKERIRPHLSRGNLQKTNEAPVTAIIAHDLAFHEDMPKNFPMKDMSGLYRDNPAAAEEMAFRNGTLQGAFFMLAARALGLDTGAMSGFDNEGIDREFFAGTSIRSNFLCNLGYGDPAKLYRRLPRYGFDEVCRII